MPASTFRNSLVWLMLLFVGNLTAAPKVLPPSQAVCGPGRALVAAQVLAIDDHAGTLDVAIAEVICGSLAQDSISLRLAPVLVRQLIPGQQVLVGISSMRKIHGSSALQPEPGGPQVLREQGLQPAVLPDSPDMRRILAGADSDLDARGEWLFTHLNSSDPQIVELAAAELVLDAEVFTRTLKANREALVQFAANPNAPPGARREVLLGANRSGEDFASGGWQHAVAQILSQLPLYLDSSTEYPSLVLNAIESYAGAADSPELTRWTASDHHAVVASALNKVAQQNPERALELAAEQLGRVLLEPEVRRVLERHRARAIR